MKFNFKRIASVLTTAVMLSSTVALAAAAAGQYPDPFVKNGVADVAVVYGSAPSVASTDILKAQEISTKLGQSQIKVATSVTTSTADTTSADVDKVQIQKSSDKLNLNNGIADVWGTALTKTELPTMLADGSFYNKQNTQYKFTQKFDLGNLSFTQFSDSDYNNRVPTLGFYLSSNTFVANYTLNFVTAPEATHGTDLSDFENKNINILGKNYYILDFKNSTAKITLLDSAQSTSLNEGDSKTVTVGAKSYDVSVNFISTDEVVLKVNNELTDKLSATGTTYGNTFKLSDGTFVGIKSINVQNYAGGSKSVEFSIGSGKLEITDGATVKINDKSITDLYGYVTLSTGSSKRTWQKLVLKWQIDNEAFLTDGKELVMPGFEAIKFTVGNTTIPAVEKTSIDYSGSDVFELKTKIKSGSVTIPLLYLASTSNYANFTGFGKSNTQKLATSNSTKLIFNATSSSSSQYEGFVASWANSREAESYYLKASVRYDADAVKNLTTITDKVTGQDLCTDIDYTTSGSCNVGSNIALTINNVTYASGGDRVVTMTINSGGSFHKLYTPEGLVVYLPVNGSTNSEKGSFPTDSVGENVWTAWFSEEDKDGTLAQKDFSVNLTTGTAQTRKVTIDNVGGAGTGYETATSSKVWQYYVPSDLATKVTWDKTNTDQYSAALEYHGGQIYSNLFVSSPKFSAVTTTTTTEVGTVLSLKDTEVTSYTNKNLIVVGGSCINSVAAKLLGSSTPLCSAGFTAATGIGAGQYLIKTFDSPFVTNNTKKVATLVAGYEAAETVNAADFLLAQNVSTVVGDQYATGVKKTVTGAVVKA